MPATNTPVVETPRVHPEMVDRPPPLALFIVAAIVISMFVWAALWSLAFVVPNYLNRDLDHRWIQLNQPPSPVPPIPTPAGQ